MKVIKDGKLPTTDFSPTWYTEVGMNRVVCDYCGFEGEIEPGDDVHVLRVTDDALRVPKAIMVDCPICATNLTLNRPETPPRKIK